MKKFSSLIIQEGIDVINGCNAGNMHILICSVFA